MKTTGDFVHDFLFIRSADAKGRSHGGFQWPLEAGGMVEAPDWDPKPYCGNGLHGLADGLGDWGLTKNPVDVDALWYICGAKRSEAVEIGSKVKVPRCKVLYVGSFAVALNMISPAMSARIMEIVEERKKAAKKEPGGHATKKSGAASATGLRGAASATGESGAASATGERGAASATGWRGAASATGESGVAMASGRDGRAMGKEGCAIFLVERNEDGKIIHVFAGIVGIDGLKPETWYHLVKGKAQQVKP